MFSLLTKYLLQYGRVCIPHIGTLEIVQEPAQHDVAEKVFLPPVYAARLINSDQVSDHQFEYMTAAAGQQPRKALLQFGEQLRDAIQRQPVKWNGFGTLRYKGNEVQFESEQQLVSSLSAIPAHKVMRENAEHRVLVGDRELRASATSAAADTKETSRSLLMIVGWTVLAAATAAVVILLITGKFQTASSGMRTFIGS